MMCDRFGTGNAMLGTVLGIGMPHIELPALTVRSISGLGVEVPMTYTLGTSRGRITKAPLFLIDVETAEGVTGRAYLWCYFPRAMQAIASILEKVAESTKADPTGPSEIWLT